MKLFATRNNGLKISIPNFWRSPKHTSDCQLNGVTIMLFDGAGIFYYYHFCGPFRAVFSNQSGTGKRQLSVTSRQGKITLSFSKIFSSSWSLLFHNLTEFVYIYFFNIEFQESLAQLALMEYRFDQKLKFFLLWTVEVNMMRGRNFHDDRLKFSQW